MTNVVHLQAYSTKMREERSFGPWRKRFGESCSESTKLADLPDETLLFLALPGEKSAMAFYELIMGVLGLGQAPKFYYLDNQDQLMVIDIHFFLADQVLFEMMRRLGWLTSFPGEGYTLLEMVQAFEKIKAESKQQAPVPTPSHPKYDTYKKLADIDKETFVRQNFRKALEAFQAGLVM